MLPLRLPLPMEKAWAPALPLSRPRSPPPLPMLETMPQGRHRRRPQALWSMRRLPLPMETAWAQEEALPLQRPPPPPPPPLQAAAAETVSTARAGRDMMGWAQGIFRMPHGLCSRL